MKKEKCVRATLAVACLTAPLVMRRAGYPTPPPGPVPHLHVKNHAIARAQSARDNPPPVHGIFTHTRGWFALRCRVSTRPMGNSVAVFRRFLTKRLVKGRALCYTLLEKQKCGRFWVRQHLRACARDLTTYTTAIWPHRMECYTPYRPFLQGVVFACALFYVCVA